MKIKGLSKVMILVLLVFWVYSYPCNVLAEEEYHLNDIEDGKRSTMTISLSYKDESLGKVALIDKKLMIYEVAKMRTNNEKLMFTLLEPFAESKINFKGMDIEQSKKYAEQLEKDISKDNVIAQSGITDEDGKITFKDLEPGMYLVVIKSEKNTKENEYVLDSYLIMAPQIYKQGNELLWNYEVNTEPKFEIRKPASSETPLPTSTSTPTQPSKPSTSNPPIQGMISHPYYGSSSSWSTPRTGDDTNVMFWWCLFGGSFIGVVAVLLTGSRKQKK